MSLENGILVIIYTTGIIIWFGLVGYLIFLAFFTKLTHVDEFRKRFLAGIFLLLAAGAILTLTSTFLPNMNSINIALIGLSITSVLVISNILIIIGLNKLDDYIYSMIGLEKTNIKMKLLLVSFPPPIIVLLIDFILSGGNSTKILMNSIFLPYNIMYCFIALYCFFLHHEMQGLKINMMLYFGIGFLVEYLIQVLTVFSPILDPFNYNIFASLMELFMPVMDLLVYNILINLFSIANVIFLILGFVNFKNRVGRALS
ncbi:MAG: hypothetical protein ACTSRG_06730 [Candidatus Helarchaeota archaeon]